MAAADGRVAFSIQPENIQAGVLDFWAVNLLTAVLPVLNPKNESMINCIVADLVMNDGIMKEKSFVIGHVENPGPRKSQCRFQKASRLPETDADAQAAAVFEFGHAAGGPREVFRTSK